MVDLGDGGAEALAQVRLDAVELGALRLQRPGLGEVQLDLQDGDEASAPPLGERALDLLGLVDLEHVAFLDVLEVLEHDAALEAGRDLAHVVVEAAQRRDLAV